MVFMTNEQKTDEVKKPEETEVNNDRGSDQRGLDFVERARKEREGLALENERFEKNIKELRELEAARLLGGTGGGHIPTMTPEMLAAQKTKKMADEITGAFK